MRAPCRISWLSAALALLSALAFASFLRAQAWQLDPTVAPRLTIERIPSLRELAFTPTPDGRILVYGTFTHLGGLASPGFARLELNGKIDAAFTPDLSDAEQVAVATALPGGDCLAVVVPAPTSPRPPGALGMTGRYWPFGLDQSVVVPVQPGLLPAPALRRPSSLLRLQSRGARDTAFIPLACDSTPRLSPFPDGRILVWGDFRTLGGVPRNGLARLASDGTLDTRFVPALAATPVVVTAAITAADGSSYVSGSFDESATKRTFFLTRLLANGERDASFSAAPPTEEILLLALQSDGSLLAGNTSLSRYLPSGTRDAAYQLRNPSLVGPVHLVPLPDGRLAVEAAVNTSAAPHSTAIFIVRPDGSVESSLAPLADNARWQSLLAVLPAGNLLLQHSSPDTGGTDGRPVLPVSAGGPTIDSWVLTAPSLSSRAPLSLAFTRHEPATVSRVETDAQGRAFVVGSFTHVDLQPRPGFARFLASGTLDRGFVPTTGNLLLVPPDGRPIMLAGGVTRLREDGSADPTFSAPPFPFGKTKWLTAAPDGRLLVATFEPDDKSEANLKLIWLDPNGRRLTTLPTSFSGFAWWSSPSNVTLIPATSATSVTTPPDPTASSLGLGPDGRPVVPLVPDIPGATYWVPQPLWAARVLADNRLLVTGDFIWAGGFHRAGAVWLKPDGSVDHVPPPPPPPGSPDGTPTAPTPTVIALTRPNFALPLPDGRALVLNPGWDGRNYNTVATCLRDDGTADPTFRVPVNTLAYSTRPLSDGSLFSEGRRFSSAGILDRNFAPQFQRGTVNALPTLAALAGKFLWVGGSFDHVNGQRRTGLARFETKEVVGITIPPPSQTLVTGRTARFDVILGTDQRATYRWTFNGVTLPGATTATLQLENTAAAHVGDYRAIVTVGGQTFTSAPATLTLTRNTSRLINVSASGEVTPTTPLIAGLSIGEVAPRPVLLRAVGRGLPLTDAATSTIVFDALVPSFRRTVITFAPWILPAAALELYRGNTLLGSDRGGATALAITNLARTTGAFSLRTYFDAPPSTNYGSALTPTLGAGTYTAVTTSADGGSGLSLFEFYDTGAASSPALIRNFAIRGQTVAASRPLVAGFVLSGNGPLRVLVRGLGPALATFGLSDTLADPKLELFARSTLLALNSGWANDPALATAARTVGAFALSPTSRDAAVLLTLEPGAYTAQLSSVSGATGAAMIEVYVVDN